MTELEDKIYKIIKKEGPILPVNISRKMEQGTMLVSAVLTSMVKQGKVNKTKQKIGSSSLYYLNSQKSEALNRILKRLKPREKKVYSFIKDKKVFKADKIGARRRKILKDLEDFSETFKYRGEKYWKLKSLPKGEAISIIREREPEEIREKEERAEGGRVGEVKKEEEKRLKKAEKSEEKEKTKEGKGEQFGPFEEKVVHFLRKKDAEILEKEVIRKKYEINLVVRGKTPFGARKFFLKARSKKRINEKELSVAYLEGNEKKMPIVFLTDGKLTNKAKKYANEELGSVFKVVKFES